MREVDELNNTIAAIALAPDKSDAEVLALIEHAQKRIAQLSYHLQGMINDALRCARPIRRTQMLDECWEFRATLCAIEDSLEDAKCRKQLS